MLPMYKRLEQLLLEGLSGASRAVLHHARKENYHTKQNWNTAIDSLDSNAQQYEKDRDRDKSLNHFKKAEEHSQQVSKLLPTVPQTHRAKKRRAFAVLRQAKEEGRSKEQSMKAFDRVYAGKAGLRLGRLVDEALSGASKAYRHNYKKAKELYNQRSLTRAPFKKYDKHTRSAFRDFEKYEAIKKKLPKLRKAIPQSPKRRQERSDPESMYSLMRSRRKNKAGLDNIIGA